MANGHARGDKANGGTQSLLSPRPSVHHRQVLVFTCTEMQFQCNTTRTQAARIMELIQVIHHNDWSVNRSECKFVTKMIGQSTRRGLVSKGKC